MQGRQLSNHQLFAYGLPGITINLVIVLFTIYLPKFYVDVVGVNLKVIGTLILIARFINAFTDPIIGILSDHTKTRWGRRRPWIFIASIVLAIIFLLINIPPIGLSPESSTIWLGITLIALLTALSALDIPYYSLGAQLSMNYHERNLLLGVRAAMQNVGILIAPILLIIISSMLGDNSSFATREKFMYFGFTGMIIILLSCWYCVFTIKDPSLTEKQKPRAGFFQNFSVLKNNKPYRILALITTLQFMGIACTTSLFLFFVQHVLQSSMSDHFIFVYTLSVVAGIPIWIWIAKKIDKRNAMVTALLLNLFVLVNMLQIGPGNQLYFAFLVAFYGITGGAVSFVLGPSMVADAIDYDEWQFGQRREGVHMGAIFFLGKIAMGISVIIVFFILDSLGYAPGKTQSATVTHGIRYMFIGLPSFLAAIEVSLFYFYPINKEMHKKIRADIDARV